MTKEVSSKLNARLSIGIEYDKDAVENSNQLFGNENTYFYQCDLENQDLNYQISEIMQKHHIKGFDILHISMVLLHLKNPFKVLRTLYRFMNSNGKIIIKDIDDGYNVAYPDEGALFAYATEIIKRNPRWGYRESGRQVYTFLKKLNCKNIVLENIGINTMNMTFSEREALFHTYFGAVIYDVEHLLKENPTHQQYIDDRQWLITNQDEMADKFYQNSFYFLLGFVVFTANIE